MAKITIPSLLPSVSAPKISASNNAYTNPQAVVDKSYEIFNKGMQEAVKNGVIAMNNDAKYRKAEFDAQAQLIKEQSDFRETEMAKVEGMANVGNANFDQNKQNYMYALKDRYVEIKNAMDKHPELQQEGARELAQINNQIKEFSSAAPLMVTAIKTLKQRLKLEPGTAGAISSKNSDGIQRILLGLEGGDADINIVTGKNGNLVLFMDQQTYTDASGKEVVVESPIEFNVSAFTQMSADGAELFETVPDIKLELEQIVKDGIYLDGGEAIDPQYYEHAKGEKSGIKGTEIQQWKANMGGNIPEFINYNEKQIRNPYYDPENPDKVLDGETAARMELITNGSLVSLVDSKDVEDQDMSIIYQDMMKMGMENDGMDKYAWGETPEEGGDYTAEEVKEYQQSKALEYLSSKAIKDYGFKERVTHTTIDSVTTLTDAQRKAQSATELNTTILNDINSFEDQKGVENYFANRNISIGGKTKEILNTVYTTEPREGTEGGGEPRRVITIEYDTGTKVTWSNRRKDEKIGDSISAFKTFYIDNERHKETLKRYIMKDLKGDTPSPSSTTTKVDQEFNTPQNN